MSDFPYNIQSSTPEMYQFKLISETGDFVICQPQPLEWRSGTIEMKRDLEAGGVFTSFIVDSLTFVGNGANFLKNLFAAKSVNAKCTLIIYYWKAFDAVPANGRQYVEFPTRYDVNFNFYETPKIGRFYQGVRVKAINSSTQTKLDNRQDVGVNLMGLTSIGGQTIIDYSLKKKLYYTATSVFYNTLLQKTGEFDVPHIKNHISYTSVPMNVTRNDIQELIQVVPYEANRGVINYITPLLKNSVYEHTFDINPIIVVHVTDRYHPLFGGSQPYELFLYELLPNGNPADSTPQSIGQFGRDTGWYSFYDPFTFTVRAGNSLVLVAQAAGIDATYHAYIYSCQLDISEAVTSSPAALTEGFPVYEALERVCQHNLDTQYPIYSEFFGRTDVNYKEGVKYSAENQLRFAHIQGGLNIRGAKLDNPDVQLPASFKDFFKSLKALWNVGYSLEYLFGEATQRIRIEEYAHFFEDTEMVFDPPLKDRISKYDIQSQVMPELIPVDLKSGFDNFEYLSINGLGEPNTTNQRTSIMNTATKWENISPFRADTKGIMDNLANPILGTSGTEDTKGDNAVFIVKTQKATAPVSGEDWIPERATNITIVSGSLFKEDLLNRYFTPSRMLIRHGNIITAGMTLPDAQASKLKFQKSDKSSTLETTGEGYTVKENADILVSDLAAPIYKAMKHTALVDFTFADLAVLKLYPYRYLKFSNNISGYLLNFKKKNNEDKCEISIIERNIVLS